jgi:hypothetical protein
VERTSAVRIQFQALPHSHRGLARAWDQEWSIAVGDLDLSEGIKGAGPGKGERWLPGTLKFVNPNSQHAKKYK